MMGTIVLAGGAEFGGAMEELDRRSLEKAGGSDASVRIIPAAAAPDNNHARAGKNGIDWFRSLGVADVRALPLIDRASADEPDVVSSLRHADLIYLLGGFPGYLAQSLADSRSWDAILAALEDGAVISGSSAGAMVLCMYFYDPHHERLCQGLHLVAGGCVVPHHRSFGQTWIPRLKSLIPDVTLIGLDEQTGLLNISPGWEWQVYGAGSVVIYRAGQIETYESGDTVVLT